jgi:hypothetical protein
MDWQQPVALGVVGITGGIFLWNRFKPRKFSFEKDTHCGCSSPADSSPKSSIVFHARKDGKRKIITKMK